MENFGSPLAQPLADEQNGVSQSLVHGTSSDISMQAMDKCQQTRLWQQNQYLSDSGIHSAVGTHTPSISSKVGLDELDHDDAFASKKSTLLPQWSASCPLSVYPSDSCLLSPATPGTGSLLGVDTLGDVSSAAGSHVASNVDLRGNKLPDIDTDEAASAIPDLVKLIKDEDDQVVIYQASMMVFQLSKSEAIDALIASRDMISCIISALDRADDPETVRFLAGTLYNMSQTQTGLKAIFAAQCVPCLVKLLNSPIESVLFYAITTLHNLLLHQEGAKAVVRQSGCLQKMTTLLQKNNIKFLTICTDCLQILAYSHQESKLQILSSGGPTELVRILRSYQYEKLLWTTARVLKVLSVCTANKPAIIEAGGMDALSKHLHHSSHRLVLNCLWTLRNLSDAATRLDNLHPLLQSLVQLLGSGESNVVTCAAGILSNLTCNNHTNKFAVYRMGGLEGLLQAIRQPGAREDILEACMCALRHLTGRHEEEEKARNAVVRELTGLPTIARIMHAATAGICPDLGLVCPPPQSPVSSWTLVKALVGLLRNLSVNLDSHHPMRESGLVTGLFLLLYATQYEISKRGMTTGAGLYSNFATIVQNVRLEEIVEGICGALHVLSKDHATRSYVARLKAPNLNFTSIIPPGGPGLAIFVHLLYSPHESIQRAAAGLLAEVSQDRDGLESLATLPGASVRLDELVHSRNEAISTYASAVVIRLTEERKTIPGASTVLPPHMETLNTPPHPMDTSGSFQPSLSNQLASNHHYANATTPHYNIVAQHASMSTACPEASMMAVSPPPGSLSAMLGPPPPVYGSGPMQINHHPYLSHHTHYVASGMNDNHHSAYWGGCSGCTDPNCMYSGPCEQPYPIIQSSGPPSHSSRQAPPCRGEIPSMGSCTASGLMHPTLHQPTNHSLSPQDYCRVSNIPQTNPRRCGSMDTSGYISPVGEFHLSISNNEYGPVIPPSSTRQPQTTIRMQPQQGNYQCSGGQTTASLALGSHPPNTGYLSPDLMSLDPPDSDWLDNPNLL